MPIRIVTLIFWAFNFFHALGDNDIDSLLYQLENCPDSSRYSILTSLAGSYYYANQLEISAKYYKMAADLEEKRTEPNLRHISESYGNYGYCMNELGRSSEAIFWYNKALEAALLNYDSTEIAAQHSNKGISYFLMGNYEKSIENYQKALAIDKALDTKETIGIDYSVIGNVFATWNKHEKAKDFFRSALEIAQEVNNPNQISTRLNKLASSCISLQQYDSALIYLNKSLSIAEGLKNDSRLVVILTQIGYAYQKSEKYDLAQEFYTKALHETEQSKDIKSEVLLFTNIAENHLSLANYFLAEEYCMKSLKKALEIDLAETVLKNYELLKTIQYINGNYKKAFEYAQLHSELKDSLFNNESQKKLTEFQVIYETEKKDNEIKLLSAESLVRDIQIKKAKQRLYFFIVISLLFVLLFCLVYYQYSQRKKINTILAEKNEQLGLLNSTKDKFISIIAHDLKNPFSAFCNISSALYQKKSKLSEIEADQLTSSLYHSSLKLKDMLNSLLDWARLQKDKIEVTKESVLLHDVVASSIEFNMDLCKPKNITILNKVDPAIFITTNKNTLLSVINNVLTNAIKFSNDDQSVFISSISKNNHVDLIIEDHGIGLSKSEVDLLFRIDVDSRKIGHSKEKGTGMGLILCKELLEKVNGTIRAESELGFGSKFIIKLTST